MHAKHRTAVLLITLAIQALASGILPLLAQTAPPSKEFIRLGGHAIAIRYADAETISTPTTPSGPSGGYTATQYTYSTGGSVSSWGHSVQYRFTWGDGTDSGWLAVGTTSASHSWTSGGYYTVEVQARCATDTATLSNVSGRTVSIQAPEVITTPSTPSGPTSGTAGTTLYYSASGASSSWSDSIQYRFDWGDGTNSGWLPVGTTSASHSWSAQQTFTVTVRARCSSHYTESADSPGLNVAITNPPPTLISLSPTGGSGSSASYQLVARDFAGASNITYMQLVVSPTYSLTSVSACHVEYVASVNALYLDGDSGGFWWVDNAPVGSGGRVIQNSQCSINTAYASVSRSGTDLTLTIPVDFKSAFNGLRYLYMSASNPNGDRDWQYFGTWQVQ